jgi:glutaredoxin
LHLVVYTKPTCPLCDEAYEVLERWQQRYGYSLEARNIEESADLLREHGEWVPVVAVNGRVRFRGRVNEVLLRRIMDV